MTIIECRKKRIERFHSGAENYIAQKYIAPGSFQGTVFYDGPRFSLEDSYDPDKVDSLMRGLAQNQSVTGLHNALDRTFVESLQDLIRDKGLRDSQVYRAAQLDRRLFSKMMSDAEYKPAKDTVLALAFALRLSLPQAIKLLGRAGYTLSHSIRRDVVIEYFFREGIYNLKEINLVLDKLEMKVIGR